MRTTTVDLILDSIYGVLLRVFLVLFPVFFLPFTAEFVLFNKLALLVIFVYIGLLLWVAKAFKEFRIFTSPLDLPIILFGAVFLVSSLVGGYSFIDAFVKPGTTTFVLGAVFLFFLITQYIAQGEDSDRRRSSLVSYYLIGIFLSTLIFLSSNTGFVSFVGKVVPLPSWLQNFSFNVLGDTLSSVVIFFVSAPLFIERLLAAYKKVAGMEGKAGMQSYLRAFGVLLVFVVFSVSTILGLYLVLSGKAQDAKILPLQSGWSITLETMKEKPIFGIGPGNFLEAFNKFRPVQYNQTDFWTTKFFYSTNFYLDVATLTGIAGLVILFFLIWRIAKNIILRRTGVHPVFKISLALSLFVFLFVPANPVVLVEFVVLLALASSFLLRPRGVRGLVVVKEEAAGWDILPAVLGFIILIGFVATLYFGGRAYAAEIYFKNALDTINKQGTYKETMDNLQNAVINNPREDAYRVAYSKISLSLVREILKREKLSDEDRNDIRRLVAFSIQQAKAAVALNSQLSENWRNLAEIYQAIIPLAQGGADQWAATAYRQAIALDPVNPVLRINLAGLFYSLGDYDSAADSARLAVSAKQDYANAYYNLALALREKGKLQEAEQAINTVLSLVKPGTKDYDLAKGILDDLQKQLKKEKETTEPQEQKQTEQQLQTPQPVKQELTPPINLPQESAPPATQSAQPKREGE